MRRPGIKVLGLTPGQWRAAAYELGGLGLAVGALCAVVLLVAR